MRRRVAAAVVGLLVGALAAGCGGDHPSAQQVAQRYVDAVTHGDYAAAARLAGVGRAEVRSAYTSLLAALSAPNLTLELDSVRGADGTAPQAAYTATLSAGGYGVYTYDGTFGLHRDRHSGDWTVTWAPTVVHPALSAGHHLALQRRFGPAGAVVDSTGKALADAPGASSLLGSGAGGLRTVFAHRLAGTPTTRVVVADGKDRATELLASFAGEPGQPVRVTLDPAVQSAAGHAVAAAGTASLVAVRASTGDLLAVADQPVDSATDSALVGRYPPGPAFAIVTATALLGDGVTPTTPVACPPVTVVGGRRFTAGSKATAVQFRQLLRPFCPTGLATLAGGLEPGALAAAAGAYGFGQAWQLAVPAFSGVMPQAAGAGERAADAVGAGGVRESPLGMALIAATVATGTWHPPLLVSDPAPAARPSARELPADVAAALRQMVGSGPITGGGWSVGYHGDIAYAVHAQGPHADAAAARVAAQFLKAVPPS